MGKITLGILDGNDVWVLCRPVEGVIGNRHTSSPRDVVENHWQVGSIRYQPEVRENSGLGWLVVVGGYHHHAISTGLFAGLVELNCVSSLVRATTGDYLGPTGRDRLTNLNQFDLLGIGQGRCLACGASDDYAIGTSRNHIVDVLLSGIPVNFALVIHGRDKCDQHLAEDVGLLSNHPASLAKSQAERLWGYPTVLVERLVAKRHELGPGLLHLLRNHLNLTLREGGEVGPLALGPQGEEVHQ